MRGLSLIIGLIGVVALLTLSVSGAWASSAAPMSCHDSNVAVGKTHDLTPGKDAPPHSPMPSKAAMVMACCVACVSPALPSGPLAIVVQHPRPAQPARQDMPKGCLPSPEHGPPRPNP